MFLYDLGMKQTTLLFNPLWSNHYLSGSNVIFFFLLDQSSTEREVYSANVITTSSLENRLQVLPFCDY